MKIVIYLQRIKCT